MKKLLLSLGTVAAVVTPVVSVVACDSKTKEENPTGLPFVLEEMPRHKNGLAFEDEELALDGYVRLGDNIKFRLFDGVGNSTTDNRASAGNIARTFYVAQIGDLHITQANGFFTDYLNTIDDWYFSRDEDGSSIIKSDQIKFVFSMDNTHLTNVGKPKVVFF